VCAEQCSGNRTVSTKVATTGRENVQTQVTQGAATIQTQKKNKYE
jgi:hypothetical protein